MSRAADRPLRGKQRPPRPTERHVDLDGARLRVLELGPADAGLRVVVVPGLGALGYLLPTLHELAARGVASSLLDLPGFGTRAPLATAPTIQGVADVAAAYLRHSRPAGRVVLFGHSTGAQAALHAAVAVQDGPRVLDAVVLGGPTVAPGQRTLLRLAATVPAAFRRDSPGELVVVQDYLRARKHALTMVRSALVDRPESTVAALRLPLTLTAGHADAFAPPWWLEVLRRAAVSSVDARVRVLPGSHNNPYTRPTELADVLVGAQRR